MPETRHMLSPLFSWRGAITSSDLPASTRLVALVLSMHMNEAGGSCFPSVETIAAEANISRSTAFRALRRLRADGWIACRQRHSDSGQQLSTMYAAALPLSLGIPVHITGENVPRGGVTHDTGGVSPVTPKDVKESDKEKEKRSHTTKSGDNSLTRLQLDPIAIALGETDGTRR